MSWRGNDDETGQPSVGPNEGKRTTRKTPSMGWWRYKEVLSYLRVDPSTLTKLMRATPPPMETGKLFWLQTGTLE